MAHVGWVYQGRQYHRWFGHGTKPGGEGGAVPTDLSDRIGAIGASVVAALPPASRRHPAATFDAPGLERLVVAMGAWVRGLGLAPAVFAERLAGREAGSSVAEAFRQSAALVAEAGTQSELKGASEALAAGMQAVGLDRWPAELGRLAQGAAAIPARATPGRYQLVLTFGPSLLRAVAIDFDPRELPLTPDAEAVGRRAHAVAVAIVVAMQGYFDDRTVQSASSTLHALFAEKVEQLAIPGLRVEQSYRLEWRGYRLW